MKSAPKYEIVNIDTVLETLDTNLPLMFDTESTHLYGPITLAQFYQESWPAVLMVAKPDVNIIIQILTEYTPVIQNASYDLTVIQIYSESRFIPPKFHDVFFLGRLKFYQETSFSLDNLMLYTLGFDPYLGQDMDKKKMQKSDWSNIDKLTEKQKLYAATDVWYMPEIYNDCKSYQEDDNYKLDILALRYSLDFQNNGFKVDAGRRAAMEIKNEMIVEDLAVPINVNSWKQVRPYIGEDESDGLALARFRVQGNQRAADVQDAKKALKQNSFLKKFDTPDGRIYGKFSPSARSGRFTCKDQNLQQLPRLTKRVFGYKPDEGRVLVFSDFSQLELRSACAVIGEHKMAELFYSGEDLHSYTRDMLFGEGKGKRERTISKTCNFNLLYGGSARMLGSILLKDALLLLPEKELNRLKAKWRKLWPNIAAWQDRGIADWKAGRPWRTPLGRRYFGKLMTDQLNICIQGTGADVAKIAMHNMMPQLPQEAKLVNFVHDSYIIDCPNDQAVYEHVTEIVGTSMKKAWETMCAYFKIKDIPMPVDVFVGYNWGDIESYDEDKPETHKHVIYKKHF